jgi:hypothetical protein
MNHLGSPGFYFCNKQKHTASPDTTGELANDPPRS